MPSTVDDINYGEGSVGVSDNVLVQSNEFTQKILFINSDII